jgi:spore coat polysaccharide biosynthesis protein SpsF
VNLATIIQARMGSTRLPGKVLTRIAGRTILEHVIGRVRMCEVDTGTLVVATTPHAGDDVIEVLCADLGVECYRSSEHDVLNRYHQAAVRYGADLVLRVTADEPLLCPDLTAAILGFADGASDYVTFDAVPLGLTGELVTAEALARMWTIARDPAEREHVTLHAVNHPDAYSLVYLQPSNLLFDRRRWRLTVDTEDDIALLERLYTLTDGELFGLDTPAILGAVERDGVALKLATAQS